LLLHLHTFLKIRLFDPLGKSRLLRRLGGHHQKQLMLGDNLMLHIRFSLRDRCLLRLLGLKSQGHMGILHLLLSDG
jgi:hypothetical protein